MARSQASARIGTSGEAVTATAPAGRPRDLADLPGPRRLPLLGNLHQLRPKHLHLTLEEWCRRHGPVFRIDIGPRRILVLGDAEEIGAVLRERPDGFRRLREIEAISREIGITGVFTAEGGDWRRQRRLAVTGLNSKHLHRYFHVVRTAARRLHSRLEDAAENGGAFDIGPELKAYTIDITSALAFGQDVNTLERRDNELQRHMQAVFDAIGRRISAPIPYWRWVRLPADRALDRSVSELRRAVGAFIDRARAEMDARPELHERPENFLQSMLAAQRADGSFTDDEIVGNTLTLLLAGEENTAHTMIWTVWFLATRHDVQRRLAREADEVLGEDPFPGDGETVERLRYAEGVLRESLRLKSVTPCLFMESLADSTIAGTHVPAGTQVFLLTRHVEASGFEHARDFDPERWLGAGHGARGSRVPLTFGAGPRVCPGRNLALLEATTAIAMVARSFELELDGSGGPVDERFAFTMHPAGLRVRLRHRPRSAGISHASPA